MKMIEHHITLDLCKSCAPDSSARVPTVIGQSDEGEILVAHITNNHEPYEVTSGTFEGIRHDDMYVSGECEADGDTLRYTIDQHTTAASGKFAVAYFEVEGTSTHRFPLVSLPAAEGEVGEPYISEIDKALELCAEAADRANAAAAKAETSAADSSEALELAKEAIEIAQQALDGVSLTITGTDGIETVQSGDKVTVSGAPLQEGVNEALESASDAKTQALQAQSTAETAQTLAQSADEKSSQALEGIDTIIEMLQTLTEKVDVIDEKVTLIGDALTDLDIDEMF